MQDNIEVNQKTFDDLKQLLGDEFDDFISIFLKDTQSNIEAIDTAHCEADITARTRLAHTVKSSLATVGAEVLSQVAFRIEVATADETIDDDLHILQKGYFLLSTKLNDL